MPYPYSNDLGKKHPKGKKQHPAFDESSYGALVDTINKALKQKLQDEKNFKALEAFTKGSTVKFPGVTPVVSQKDFPKLSANHPANLYGKPDVTVTEDEPKTLPDWKAIKQAQYEKLYGKPSPYDAMGYLQMDLRLTSQLFPGANKIFKDYSTNLAFDPVPNHHPKEAYADQICAMLDRIKEQIMKDLKENKL